jgi:hypothetical protein
VPAETVSIEAQGSILPDSRYVRFGSEADISQCNHHVCSTRESGHSAYLLTFGHGPVVGGTGADSGGAGCGDGVVGAGAGFGARFLDFALLAGFAIFIPFFFRAGAPRFAFLDFFATFNIPIKIMPRLTATCF